MRPQLGSALGVGVLAVALVGCGPSITKGLTPTVETTPATRPGTSTSSTSTSVVTDQPTGATALSLSPSDLWLVSVAYQNFSRFPCAVTPVRETVRSAAVPATGAEWAIATMQPRSGCTVNGQNVDPNQVLGGGPERAGVFEKQSGGSWQMNWFETEPFPCPPNLAVRISTPGPQSPYLPTAVVRAMGLSFSPKCSAAVFVPPHPQ